MEKPSKLGSYLPLIALALSSVPLLFIFLAEFFSLLLPPDIFWLTSITGIITGIVSICLGKERIGKKGVVISILAIALPLVAVIVTFVIIFIVAANA